MVSDKNPTLNYFCELAERAHVEQTGSYHDLEYYVDRSIPGITGIGIRGTEATKFFSKKGFIDVLRDVFAVPRWSRALGWTHAGFSLGARGIFKQLNIYPGYGKYRVTGHSLGAGVGFQLAKLLHHSGYEVEFVGFGMPNGDLGKRAIHFSAITYRYGSDAVTLMPDSLWLPWCKNVRQIDINPNDKFPNFEDHERSNYFEALMT